MRVCGSSDDAPDRPGGPSPRFGYATPPPPPSLPSGPT